jgi:hypothetical protein
LDYTLKEKLTLELQIQELFNKVSEIEQERDLVAEQLSNAKDMVDVFIIYRLLIVDRVAKQP